MRIVALNIWEAHTRGAWICITTNGLVTRDGRLVMGRGTALQATKRYPTLPRELGSLVSRAGNVPIVMPQLKLITFPVKHHWYDLADITLIKQSLSRLCALLSDPPLNTAGPVYLPKPGCGNGQLQWRFVRPQIEPRIDSFNKHFTQVEIVICDRPTV